MPLAQRASAPVYRAKRGAFASGGTVDVTVSPSSAAPTVSANSAVPPPTPVTDATNAAGTTSAPMAPPTAIPQPAFNPQPYSSSIANVPSSALTGGAGSNGIIAPISNLGVPSGSPSAPKTPAPMNGATPSAFGTALPPPTPTDPSATANSVSPTATLSSLFGPNISQALNVPDGWGVPSGADTFSQLTPDQQTAGQAYLSAHPQTAKRGGAIKKFAAGGGAPSANEMMPFYARAEERGMLHPEGLVKSFGGGRTDIHPIDVPAGAYVVPADVTSGLAEGNTLAGSGVIDMMMHSNPYGIQGGKGRGGGDVGGPPKAHQGPLTVEQTQSRGGTPKSQGGSTVPIIVAGGEHIIYPQTIMKKFGDLKRGHQILDKWVVNTRQQIIKDMRGLKPPKK